MKINVEQGTKKWHEIRAGKWTASNSPVVMGVSKFKSKSDLKKELIERKYEQKADAPIYHGTFLEPFVRDCLNDYLGTKFIPEVHIALEDDRFLASLDGVHNNECGLEIKCPFSRKSGYMDLVKSGIVPNDLMYQVQHQMYCAGLTKTIVVVYLHNETIYKGTNDIPDEIFINPENLFILEVNRDDSIINTIKEAWEEFDFFYLSGAYELSTSTPAQEKQKEIIERYLAAQSRFAQAKQEFDEAEKQLEEILSKQDADIIRIGKYRVERKISVVKGSIDYSNLIKSMEISTDYIETFRKQSTTRKSIKVLIE